MSDQSRQNDAWPEYDATNAVRLCDRCEEESGVSAGADAGDRACSICGSHDAPHVYPGPVGASTHRTPSRGPSET
jgi:hypothetical protein